MHLYRILSLFAYLVSWLFWVQIRNISKFILQVCFYYSSSMNVYLGGKKWEEKMIICGIWRHQTHFNSFP